MTIYCCSNQAVLRRPLEPELYTTVKVTNRAGTAINTPFAMLRHGQAYTAKLPRTSGQTGGPHANAISGLGSRVIFR